MSQLPASDLNPRSSKPTQDSPTATSADALLTPSNWRALTWGIIGCGRVGATFAKSLAGFGVGRVLISSNDPDKAARLCAAAPVLQCTTRQQVAQHADLVLLTVPDDAIAACCNALTWRTGQGVVHCSGATPIDALAHAQAQGAWIGGFHPLQVFGDSEQALASLPGCSIAIEASGPLHDVLSQWAAALHSPVLHLPPGGRALYHAGAGYAAGSVVALIDQACQLWATLGWSERDTLNALLPLLRNTVDSLAQRGVTASMAGPVSRADVGTINRHISDLRQTIPEALPLYLELVQASIPVVERRAAATSAQMQRMLDTVQRERLAGLTR